MATIEQAFAIGRPAKDTTEVTCRRCKGTGWWQLGRKCFGCGGLGRSERVTKATKLRDKRAQVAEVAELVERHTARLAELGPDAPRWKRMAPEDWLVRDTAHLAKLQAELAALEGQE
jgi:ribosomal protein L37E